MTRLACVRACVCGSVFCVSVYTCMHLHVCVCILLLGFIVDPPCWLYPVLGWIVSLHQLPLFCCFHSLSDWSKHSISVEYHNHIWGFSRAWLYNLNRVLVTSCSSSFQCKDHLLRYSDFHCIWIRWLWSNFIHKIGIPVWVRQHFDFEIGPKMSLIALLSQTYRPL